MSQTTLDPVETGHPTPTSHRWQVGVRLVAAAALAVTAAAHVPVAVDHLGEDPYLGWAFYGFIVLAAAGAGSLLVENRLWVWRAMGALNASAVLLFVASRLVGLPGAGDDRGDWNNPTARVCLAAELVVVVLAAWVLRPETDHPARSEH